ncbi:MAG: hypothetical protein J7L34_04800, partial [Thermotogaceae bacterium]|nr:hypothetical protein [Thermotogaceae bacterium]
VGLCQVNCVWRRLRSFKVCRGVICETYKIAKLSIFGSFGVEKTSTLKIMNTLVCLGEGKVYFGELRLDYIYSRELRKKNIQDHFMLQCPLRDFHKKNCCV